MRDVLLIALLVGIPAAVFMLFVVFYGVNAPAWDDYDAALNFIIRYKESRTLFDVVEKIFAQHNEHRIVFDRLVFLTQYLVMGSVNFRAAALFGNAGLVLAVMVIEFYLYIVYRPPVLFMMPLPYLLLSMTHHQNMFQPMAALQNYWSFLFSVACLICLVSGKHVAASILFVMALFTSGSSIVLLPIIAVWLIVGRNLSDLRLFGVVALVSLAVYFFGYQRPSYHPSITESLLNPGRTVTFFFSFLGNFMPAQLAVALGIVQCALAIVFFVVFPGDKFLNAVSAFVLLSALVAAITRSGFGVEHSLMSKYTLYSVMLLACLVFQFLVHLPQGEFRRSIVVFVVGCAIIFWGAQIAGYELNRTFANERESLVVGMAEFCQGGTDRLAYPDQGRASDILTRAEQMGIYDPASALR